MSDIYDEDVEGFNEEDVENEIPEYDDLTEEEILARQKEFAMLNTEGKEMLRDITGIQNSRVITLNALMLNSYKVVYDADDNIEDVEFSSEYLKFISWYCDTTSSGMFDGLYAENEKIFEDILNKGLENEDDNNIFAYFKKMYIEKIRGITKEIDEPLSGLEQEAGRRFEKLSTTEKDLVDIFQNIRLYKDMDWNTFANTVL